MKAITTFLGFFLLSTTLSAQTVIASGQEPAWFLEYDGGKNLTLYIGENSFAYSLVSIPAPEGSTTDIAQSYVMKGENGKNATLVFEYFDPESAESCPCFHDLGEGLNKGKAYLITENNQFFIGCADFTEAPLTYVND
jgi:hypothetical protein